MGGWRFMNRNGEEKVADPASYASRVCIFDHTVGPATESVITVPLPQLAVYRDIEFVFDGLKQTYTPNYIGARMNGLSTTIYDFEWIIANPSVAGSESGSQNFAICHWGYGSNGSSASGANGAFRAMLFNYLNGRNKTLFSEFHSDWGGGTNGVGGRGAGIATNLVRIASPITTVDFAPYGDGSLFEIGSRLTAYAHSVVQLPPPGAGVTRMVTGSVNSDGSLGHGTGFTPSRTATGRYTITFATPFGNPVITLGPGLATGGAVAQVISKSGTAISVEIFRRDTGADIDTPFDFIVMEAI